jgi:hypothetical protein
MSPAGPNFELLPAVARIEPRLAILTWQVGALTALGAVEGAECGIRGVVFATGFLTLTVWVLPHMIRAASCV